MRKQRLVQIGAGLLVGSCLFGSASFSQAPESERVSRFASSDDLLRQVDFFVARIEASLSDPAGFDLAKQSRVWKDGNTLAALALTLAMHDEAFANSPRCPHSLRVRRRWSLPKGMPRRRVVR